jgi:nucleoside triphosphate diphosphatase
MRPQQDAGKNFEEAVAIMARLRAPGGCPWDREQSFDSIRKYTLEETYEVFDAIERRNWADLKEELGDLLLQVLFYSEMASEAGDFTIAEVIVGLNQKLVRRHPHVFGDEAAAAAGNVAQGLTTDGIDSRQVLRNWEHIKQLEKNSQVKDEESKGRLDAIPRALPALLEATKLGSKAAKVGFDWPDVRGLFDKVQEEVGELQTELAAPEIKADKVTSELGDLLFTVVNLARHLHVDPEFALRETNAKFRRRFAAMEATSVKALEELPAESLEKLWSAAKEQERSPK